MAPRPGNNGLVVGLMSMVLTFPQMKVISVLEARQLISP